MKLLCFILFLDYWCITKYSRHRIKGTLINGSSVLWGQVSGDKSPCTLFLSVKRDSTSDEGDLFFLKVYFHILSSSQKLFQCNKCYVWQPSESCSSPCSLDSCYFMFCLAVWESSWAMQRTLIHSLMITQYLCTPLTVSVVWQIFPPVQRDFV